MSFDLPKSISVNEYYKYPEKDLSHKKAPVPTVAVATIDTLFPKLDQWAIGYRNYLDTLQQLAQARTATFPPCNITRDDNKYEIVLAVAGYRREYLKISLKDQVLTVETTQDMERDDIRTVIHQGIAQRNFKHTFALAEYVNVKDAKLQDGLLTIMLELELPEEKKPKEIDIKVAKK